MKFLTIIIIGSTMLGLVGCGSTNLVNTSPVQNIPKDDSFETIPATVLVKSEDTEVKVSDDIVDKVSVLVSALQEYKVFEKVVSELSGDGSGELELVVKQTAKSDHHLASGTGKAIISGCTLGIGSFFQTNEFDYSVTIKSKLRKDNVLIAEYESIGSHHLEYPKTSRRRDSNEQIGVAVGRSYGYAIGLLINQIKRDRAKIMEAIDSDHK